MRLIMKERHPGSDTWEIIEIIGDEEGDGEKALNLMWALMRAEQPRPRIQQVIVYPANIVTEEYVREVCPR